MPANKHDRHAREHWGEIYDALPKSVFATVAWHLANVASGNADNPGSAKRRFISELNALVANNIIPAPQAARIRGSRRPTWRYETEGEHAARDIREGRFPQRSAVEMVPVYDPDLEDHDCGEDTCVCRDPAA